jgi:circadian clock protein KaiC
MAGALQGERGLIMSFQENPVQLREMARALSWDTKALEAQGSLSHLYQSPVEMQCDIYVARIREAAEKLDARRVLIDSITDLEIALSDKVRYNDCISMLINMFKIKGITILLTFAMPELSGPVQLGGDGAFFSTDNLILLRYVEQAGRMGRSINVLKMRGSPHSQEIREFEITPAGIRIGDPLHVLTG